MDPARQSALVGAALGAALAAMGLCIVAIGTGWIPARMHFPRAVVAFAGVGLMLCGAAFALATRRRRAGLALAIPGAAFAFALPIGWAALSPAKRECTLQSLGFGYVSVSAGVPLDAATCGDVLTAGAILALATVAGMVLAWLRLRDPP
jgi:hypothetical protein